jgi:hypothetical protein
MDAGQIGEERKRVVLGHEGPARVLKERRGEMVGRGGVVYP